MRTGPDDAFHLSYCTNIHPGESWTEVRDVLRAHLPGLKERLAPEDAFGVGLRLSDRASRELLAEDRLARFGAWLEECGCYVYTINGFPYGRFHGERVKDQVYRPDWRNPERVEYTVRLARILAELLPEGVSGSISTSPLSYKPWLEEGDYAAAKDRASRHLSEVVDELARIEEERGREIHVAIEPEPDCLIEDLDETIAFFEDHLIPVAGARLAERRHVSRSEAESLVRRHVGLCYDTCHFAVEYDEAEDVLERVREAGIRIGKVQLSSALRVDLAAAFAGSEAGSDGPSGGSDALGRVGDHLAPFSEDVYLHQVVARTADGALRRYRDLGPALASLAGREGAEGGDDPESGAAISEQEWRIHYHVPLFVDRFDGLGSTQETVARALAVLIADPSLCPHLEIETYTWEVLPDRLKLEIDDSIAREYRWVLDRITEAIS